MLYDKNGKELSYDKFKYYDSGYCARIYNYDNIILKIYKYDCKLINIIKKKMFNEIKEIDDKCLVQLIDYYSIFEKNGPFSIIDAYTMKKVNCINENILFKDINYLLECTYELEKMIEKLSKKKIIMFDANERNIIFGENNATIIDPDKFYFSKIRSYKHILYKNKNVLLDYIILYLRSCTKDIAMKNNIYRLLNHNIKYDTELCNIIKEAFNNEEPYKVLKKQ